MRSTGPSRTVTRRTVLVHGTAMGAALGLGHRLTTAQGATPAPSPTPPPPNIERHSDVVYGEAGGEELLLDVRVPLDWPAPRPAVIVIHGGGLVLGSKDDALVPALELAFAGYTTFTINYRLFNPDTLANPWPAQLDDVQRAVRWVRAHAEEYGIDPDRVAAYGHSSGGTLATALGVRETRDDSVPELAGISSRVNSVVDLSGDVDLTIPYPDPYWSEVFAAMLGGTPEEQPEAYRDASPLYQVDENSAPFLVMHGAQDTDTPVEHSRRLVEALHQAKVEVTYGEYPTAGHREIADWALNGPWTLVFLGQQPTKMPSGMGGSVNGLLANPEAS